MKLKVKRFNFSTGRPVCMVNETTARELSLYVGQRILIKKNGKKIISVVNIIEDTLKKNEIAVSKEISSVLNIHPQDKVEVEIAEQPHSIELIKEKLKGRRLKKKEIYEIIENIANNALTEVEVAFFVSAVYEEGMSVRETRYLTKAMVETGNKLRFKGLVVDKHSVGGIAGNRTTPIVVSICSAVGLIMPKTSSRAITSAAGTADVIEAIAKVDFNYDEIKKIVKKTNACMVWGGSLGLAPVDDKIIKIEKIVNIDSFAQVIASILSKKISVGSKYILIDIPCGKSAKFTKKEAQKLKTRFLELGKFFKLNLKILITDGNEPIGNGIGPMLEIKDVIKVLRRENPPLDLEKKSVFLAGKLLELSKKAQPGEGIKLATEILNSGLAFKKFLEIIKTQKGDIKKIAKMHPGYTHHIKASKKSTIKHIDNKLINNLARLCGCPEDKAAGIYLHRKKGQVVNKHEKILTLYAQSEEKLKHARAFYKKNKKKIVEY
ncbi:thymidine phosphorylase [Candidatus Pacearchaeota archaeon]|nr:thymidine phosphorylase [Candidatus Pacearchaeota archaeon]